MSIHFAGSVLVLVVAALAGLAPVARAADGVVDLSWDTCSPIVVNVTSAGTGSMSLIASVIGNDQIHYGYQVRFQLGDPSNLVPDAWRFDGPGCQGSSALAINHMVPAALAGSCPVFHADRPSIFIKEYALFRPGSGHPTTLARGLLAIVYPVGTKAISEQRYFLAQFLFDHSQSVAGPTTQGTRKVQRCALGRFRHCKRCKRAQTRMELRQRHASVNEDQQRPGTLV